jgi:uncharacterized damage-inducible protein DinB
MPRIADSLIAELEQEAETTRKVLERVPGDKLTWKPHEKSFTLGQLAFHIAGTPGGVAAILAEDTYEQKLEEQEQPESAGDLIPAFEKSVAAAKEILDGWDDAKLMAKWRYVQDGNEILSMPRVAMVRAILLNHWYHHRGQLTVYLRLLDVPVPSVYGRSADENPLA